MSFRRPSSYLAKRLRRSSRTPTLASPESSPNPDQDEHDKTKSSSPASAISRFGLSELFTPVSSSPAVDLVFIHGLNGDPERTWTSKENQVFWPRELLPGYLDSYGVRILTYGYDSEIVSVGSKGTGVSKDKIHNHAERLVSELCSNRGIRDANERPIIFVAHSLGGLVVKRALIYSTEITGEKTDHLRSIAVSTFGILFMGTPHRGSDIGQWGSYLESLFRVFGSKKLLDTQPQLLQALKTNSETLQNIDRQFSMLIEKYHLYFFHEGKPTDLKGTLRFIVSEESAAPELADVERASIPADHSSMCKFASVNSPGFDLVLDGLQRYAKQAPNVIEARWVAEIENRQSKRLQKVKELIGNDAIASHINLSPSSAIADDSVPASSLASSQSLEPLFVVPPGFRANSVFVGRKKELHALETAILDNHLTPGTTSALVYGPPGVGKTYLVKQFVTSNRHSFSGGMFWINANSMAEFEHDVWLVAEKIIAKSSPEHLSAIRNQDRHFSRAVREWFERRTNWLIVVDGISIEKSQDIDKLTKFLPDAQDSSIIYTCRSSMADVISKLFNPKLIRLKSFKEDPGVELLLQELHVAHPRPSEMSAARELVSQVGGLPLAIDALARRTAATHVPLEKQKGLSGYSKIPELTSTYHKIMDDLQQNDHVEAINLLSILCFFGPNVPVELVHLGSKALSDISLESSPDDGSNDKDLNFTIAILMQHAIVERNEPEDDLSVSDNSLHDPEPIDMLKMHTVLQKYRMDHLENTRQLRTWLDRAVTLLSYSYGEAMRRVKDCREPARASDFRQYSIHAQQLLTHVKRYQGTSRSMTSTKKRIQGTLQQISDKIMELEARVSQESLDQIVFQTSIFDRTNTDSASSDVQSQTDSVKSSTRSVSRSSSSSTSRQRVESNEATGPARLDDAVKKSNSQQSTHIPREPPGAATPKPPRPEFIRDGSIRTRPSYTTSTVDPRNVHGASWSDEMAKESDQPASIASLQRLHQFSSSTQPRPSPPAPMSVQYPYWPWPWQGLASPWWTTAAPTVRGSQIHSPVPIIPHSGDSPNTIIAPEGSKRNSLAHVSGRVQPDQPPLANQGLGLSMSDDSYQPATWTKEIFPASRTTLEPMMPTADASLPSAGQNILVPVDRVAQLADGTFVTRTVLQPMQTVQPVLIDPSRSVYNSVLPSTLQGYTLPSAISTTASPLQTYLPPGTTPVLPYSRFTNPSANNTPQTQYRGIPSPYSLPSPTGSPALFPPLYNSSYQSSFMVPDRPTSAPPAASGLSASDAAFMANSNKPRSGSEQLLPPHPVAGYARPSSWKELREHSGQVWAPLDQEHDTSGDKEDQALPATLTSGRKRQLSAPETPAWGEERERWGWLDKA